MQWRTLLLSLAILRFPKSLQSGLPSSWRFANCHERSVAPRQRVMVKSCYCSRPHDTIRLLEDERHDGTESELRVIAHFLTAHCLAARPCGARTEVANPPVCGSRNSTSHCCKPLLCMATLPPEEGVERPPKSPDWARHISIRACGGKSEQLWTYSLQCGATALTWERFGTAWPAGWTLHCAFLLQRHPDLHTLCLSADGKPQDLHSHSTPQLQKPVHRCRESRFLSPCMDPAGPQRYISYILDKTLRRRPTPTMKNPEARCFCISSRCICKHVSAQSITFAPHGQLC